MANNSNCSPSNDQIIHIPCLQDREASIIEISSENDLPTVIDASNTTATSPITELLNFYETKDISAFLSSYLKTLINSNKAVFESVSKPVKDNEMTKNNENSIFNSNNIVTLNKDSKKLGSKFYAKKVPPISIESYLLRIVKLAKMQNSTLIIIGILIERILFKNFTFLEEKCIHK